MSLKRKLSYIFFTLANFSFFPMNVYGTSSETPSDAHKPKTENKETKKNVEYADSVTQKPERKENDHCQACQKRAAQGNHHQLVVTQYEIK